MVMVLIWNWGEFPGGIVKLMGFPVVAVKVTPGSMVAPPGAMLAVLPGGRGGSMRLACCVARLWVIWVRDWVRAVVVLAVVWASERAWSSWPDGLVICGGSSNKVMVEASAA
ncbi:hypothetical protein ATCCBAA256_22200 [Mycobacterium montefiorense]|nr:hypothetical protein ATCCBAA256_22200 [Mycobacterium montefiorense]